MPLPNPTFGDLLRQNIAEFRTRLPGVDTSPGSDIYARAWSLAQLEADGYTRTRYLLRQISPATAEAPYLLQHGRTIGVTPLPATTASGIATFRGTSGTAITAGMQLTDPTGAVFKVTNTVTIPPFLAQTVAGVVAATPGVAGNLADGTVLTLTTPVTGLDPTATVTGDLSGGSETETTEEVRKRVLRTMQFPPASGNDADVVAWIESVAGVRRGFAWPSYDGPGTVRFAFQGVYVNGRDGRIAHALEGAVQEFVGSQIAEVARQNANVVVLGTQPVDVEIRVAPKGGFEFDWTGSMAATAVTGSRFAVSSVPAGLRVGHRVVWAPAAGMQIVASVTSITGSGPYTIDVGADFGSGFTGSQTIYPAGDLTTSVAAALLAEGGIFDQLTPGDRPDATRYTQRFPPVGSDYPTDLLKAELIADAFKVAGVGNVDVVSPSADVAGAFGSVIVPRQVLVRPLGA